MEFRYERYRYLSLKLERRMNMTFYNNQLEYRVTLNTELNLFIVFDKKDENHFATGRTIEEAVQSLIKNL